MSLSSSKTSTSSTTQPLQWQEDAVKSAFGDAENLYNQQTAAGTPNFNTYVGLNGTQTNALNQAVTDARTQNTAGQTIQNAGTQTSAAAPAGTAALTSAAQAAQSGADGNFNQGTTATSQALQNATGTNAATATNALNNAYALSSTDPTQSNIQNATNYMNSSGVQDAIKDTNALSDDLYQRTTVPDMNAQAISGGNLNSSRAGAAQAIADDQQQLSDKATASTMLQNAYNTGLSLSEQARESNLSGSNSTASTGQAGASLGLQGQTASNDQTNANNTLQQNYISQLGTAGNSLVNAGATGAQMASTGAGITNTADSNALNAGTAYQTAAQNQNDANLQAQLSAEQYPWTELQNLYGVIGANNWGQQSNSTTTSTPSVASTLQGAVGSIAGLTSAATGGSSLMNLFGSGSGANAFGGSGLDSSSMVW